MKQRRRIYYNAQQRALMWDRYQQGDTLLDIARMFDRYHSSIQGIFIKQAGSGQLSANEALPICISMNAQKSQEV